MSWRTLTLFALTTLSCLPPGKVAAPGPKECVLPEDTIYSDLGPAHLLECAVRGTRSCCGYGFLPLGSNGPLCALILCQVDDCSNPWEHVQTICVPEEEPVKPRDAGYEAWEDEGWSEGT